MACEQLSERIKEEISSKSDMCFNLHAHLHNLVMVKDEKKNRKHHRFFPKPILEFVKKINVDTGLEMDEVTGTFGGTCVFQNCSNNKKRQKNNKPYEALMLIIDEKIASGLEVVVRREGKRKEDGLDSETLQVSREEIERGERIVTKEDVSNGILMCVGHLDNISANFFRKHHFLMPEYKLNAFCDKEKCARKVGNKILFGSSVCRASIYKMPLKEYKEKQFNIIFKKFKIPEDSFKEILSPSSSPEEVEKNTSTDLDAFIDAAENLPLSDEMASIIQCWKEKVIELENKLQEAYCEIDKLKGNCESDRVIDSFDMSYFDSPQKKNK